MSANCPAPERLVRAAAGDLSGEESAAVLRHAATCADCRAELAALGRVGPAAAWNEPAGDPAPLPDSLWRGIAASVAPAPLRLRVRMARAVHAARNGVAGAGRRAIDRLEESAAAAGSWIELASGQCDLLPIERSALRGPLPEAAAESPEAPLAVRLVAGPHEAFIRRNEARLTVIMTAHGDPASGRVVRLAGAGRDESSVTDSTGCVVFRTLGPGDYIVELEGMES
jgi:hypothetical protein